MTLGWTLRCLMLVAVVLLGLGGCGSPTPPPAPPRSVSSAATIQSAPPVAAADPYLRFEDMEAAETNAWVAARNAEARTLLDGLPSRPYFHAGISKYIRSDELDLPWGTKAGQYYYLRKLPDRDHRVLVRSRKYGDRAREQVVLDPNTWSTDGSEKLTGWVLSNDERRMAYGTSTGGSDWTRWRIVDLTTLQPLSDELRGIKWDAPQWTPDDKALLYSGYDNRSNEEGASGKGNQIYFHRVGTEQEADPVVYRPANEEWIANPGISEAGDFVIVYIYKSSDGQGRIELYPLPKALPEDPASIFAIDDPHILSPDFAYRQWDVASDPGVLYMFSEKDAPTGRVDRYTLSTRKLETIVAPREQTLTNVSRAGGFLFSEYIEDVKSFVVVTDLSGKLVDEVRSNYPSNMWGFRGKSWHKETFYGAVGHAQPYQVFRYNLAEKKSQKVWEVEIDFQAADYVAEQVFYPSKDGTKVPMFVVHRRDVTRDGTAPTMLLGYGCYGYVMPIQFSSVRVPWLERGGVIAIANIRGGGAYGQRWHRAGKKENKQNSIDDFVAAAEWLHQNRVTAPEHTNLAGASCGGLLVGATLTQRPELFAAAVPEVGVLDLVRYHLFSGAYLWKDELGSSDVPEERAYLEKLSPVLAAQVKRAYPATLVTTRKKDTRVAPMNAYKFAAALSEHQTGEAPILLRVDETGGHSTSSLPLDMRVDYLADIYAFAWEMSAPPLREP